MRRQRWPVLLLCLIAMAAQAADQDLTARLTGSGHVLMIRHALAPGTGDPPGFDIDDCATQRNLDEEGRRQARAIGDWLQDHGVDSARVYSSQWCRCLETAELLNLGAVKELPALNSFYQRPKNREPNLAALRAFLAAQPLDAPLIIMVTHQVTISAITGKYTASGHGVLLKLNQGGKVKIARLLDFDI